VKIEDVQKKLQQMGDGKLKAVEKKIRDLGLKHADLQGEQETLADSVKVRCCVVRLALVGSCV
jgi:hypothetical protein